jgi:DNA (cytosine-5)-methyltransferase 1
MTLYNENDPGAVEWLTELQSRGLIARGDIDGRSIEELRGEDCELTSHFFAGIGGWAYALQLAGWDPARPVWSGSCPCQPFSTSGAKRGFSDSKHLWPVWYELIRECRPAVVFGEQTASALGREWLARVRADLEELGYAVGAADLCAAGVNAPQRRQRLYWVAHAGHGGDRGRDGLRDSEAEPDIQTRTSETGATGREDVSGLGTLDVLADGSSEYASFWDDYDIAECRSLDGTVQYRRVESGTLPLVDGVPERVGRIRGYGNAIVPQLAATFVRSFMEAAGYMPGVARSGWSVDVRPGEVVEVS